MPNLSVIIGNYNHAQYLKNALEDFLALKKYFLEIIIADDASTDNSWAILQEYAKKYPVIRLIRNPVNLGVIGNYSMLLKEAKGEFVTMPAMDDHWITEPMERLLQKMDEHPELDMFCANGYVFYEDEGRKAIRPVTIPDGIYYSNSVMNFNSVMPWAPSGTIVRRSLMCKIADNVWPAGCYHDGLYQLIVAQYHSFYYQAEYSTVFRIAKNQYSHALSVFKAHWDIYPFIFSMLQTKYPELYQAMLKANMFRIFQGVDYFLLCHSEYWDRNTIKIIVSVIVNRWWTLIRHNWLPKFFPESVKQKYRSCRSILMRKMEK